MIPKKPAPDLIRGGNRFSACAGMILVVWTNASAGVGRPDQIMRNENQA